MTNCMVAYQLKYLEEDQIRLEDVMYYEPLLSYFMEVMQIICLYWNFLYLYETLCAIRYHLTIL